MEGSFEHVLAQLRNIDVDGQADRISRRDEEEDRGVEEEVQADTNNNGPNHRRTRSSGTTKKQREPPLALSLTNVAVTNDMARVFGEALLNSQHHVAEIKLQVFWMSASRTEYASLLQYLRDSPCLTTISFYGNPTGVPGCKDTVEQLLSAVAANGNVQEINLAWIELSAQSLVIQRNIKELILIRSTIVKDENDETAETVTISTPLKLSNLTTLIMDVWDDDSKETLLTIGATHTNVETLYVRFPLSFVQAQPIIDFVSGQTQLKEVLLRNMGADLSHITSLIEAMPTITTSVEAVHGYWESPAMQAIASSTNKTTCLYKTKMIDAMYKTNSLIMLHCYAATPESKRESMFSTSEQAKIKEIGSRNYMLPLLMQSSNLLWNDTDNWPALLALGVSSDHPMHFSLVYELVQARLMQRPSLRRRGISGKHQHRVLTTGHDNGGNDGDDDDDVTNNNNTTTTKKTPYQRFFGWVERQRVRTSSVGSKLSLA